MATSMTTSSRRKAQALRLVIVSLCIFIMLLLSQNDPERGGFPHCPFLSLTGFLCPGCGSQRAMHDLLHLRVAAAYEHNALLVICMPLLLIQWIAARWGLLPKPPSAYNPVVFAWLVATLGWGLIRNMN